MTKDILHRLCYEIMQAAGDDVRRQSISLPSIHLYFYADERYKKAEDTINNITKYYCTMHPEDHEFMICPDCGKAILGKHIPVSDNKLAEFEYKCDCGHHEIKEFSDEKS